MLKPYKDAPVLTYRYRGTILRGEIFECRRYLPNVDDASRFVFLHDKQASEGDMLAYCPKGFLDVYLVSYSMFWRDFVQTGWSADSTSMTWHNPGPALRMGAPLDWRACCAPPGPHWTIKTEA